MKEILLIYLFTILTQVLYSQSQDVWVRFFDKKTGNAGYKDLKGKIMVPASFEGGMVRADTFHNIIAVMEPAKKSYRSYYLLKDGRKVAEDSVYMFDFLFDCESEDKIMFRDNKKDRVGFLDKNGLPVIPAIYNYVSPFKNNVAVAHRNAKRICADEDTDIKNCEHPDWLGGETILINQNNEVLVDSLTTDVNYVNWYSKRINDPTVDTTIYISLKGRDNNIYSFVDYHKEFQKWFNNTFIPALRSPGGFLKSLLFTEITHSSPKKGWTPLQKNKFLQLHPTLLTSDRFETSNIKEISIMADNPWFNSKNKLFNKYYDACGERDRYRFPAFDVMLTYYKKRLKPASDISGIYKDHELDYQEHFVFLRTEEGYKLFQVASHR